MAFIPLANGAEVAVHYRLMGSQLMNRFFILFDSAPDLTALQGAADDFDTWVATDIMPISGNTLSYVEVVVTDWSTSTGLQATAAPGSPVPGGGGSAALTNGLAVLANLKTGHRGRSYTGKTYIPGPQPTSLIDENTLSSTAVSAYDAAMFAIPGHGDTTPYGFVVASFYSGIDPVTHKPIPRTAGIATPVTEIVINPLLAYQRRRKPGVGV